MRAGLLSLAGLAALACGPTSYDVFLEGQRLAGEAERGACRLVWDKEQGAHVINKERIATCLDANRRALAKHEEAAKLGHTGRDFELAKEELEVRIGRLESMLRTVARMQDAGAAERELEQAKSAGRSKKIGP